MADNSIALRVDTPDLGNSFSKGYEAAQGRQMNTMKMEMAQKEQGRAEAMQLMELMGSIGLGAMGGNIEGQADPAKWEEGLNYLDSLGIGLDTQKYRGKPQMARMLVDASVSAADRLKMAKDDREFQMTLAKFDQDLARHDENIAVRREGLDIQRQRLDTVKNKKTPLSATAQKELFEADEGIQAGESVISALDKALELNDKALSGPGAGTLGKVGSWVGVDSAVATEDLKNIVTAQALENLKATFGGMPTEGERKILLEIQGSVDQAPEVRRGIYERAKALAARRIEFSKKKAAQLRSGEYFSEQGPSGDPDTAADETANDAAANRQVIDGITYEQDETGEWYEVE